MNISFQPLNKIPKLKKLVSGAFNQPKQAAPVVGTTDQQTTAVVGGENSSGSAFSNSSLTSGGVFLCTCIFILCFTFRLRIHHLLQANPKLQSRNIRVKITSDGNSRNIHLVVIAFSLLDFNENWSSPYGCLVIALLKTTENYNNLDGTSVDIVDEMKIVPSITVNILMKWKLYNLSLWMTQCTV